jgi:hypothetical protein
MNAKVSKGQGLAKEDIFVVKLSPVPLPWDDGIRTFSTLKDLLMQLKHWRVSVEIDKGLTEEEIEQLVKLNSND